MTTRKKYTKEFKLDAVSLVVEQGYSRADAARRLEIDPSLVRRWVKEHQTEDDQAFRGNGKLTSEQEEIKKLKAQVKPHRLPHLPRRRLTSLPISPHPDTSLSLQGEHKVRGPL